MSKRERLDYFKLLERAAQMARNGKTETTITYDEFCDLKMDMNFVMQFNWGMSQTIPREFAMNGVIVKVEERK